MEGTWTESTTSDEDKEVVRLWRVWKTMIEMMQDRGYEVSENEPGVLLPDFKARFTTDGMAARERMVLTFDPSPEMLVKHTPLPTKSEPNPVPTIGKAYVRFSKDSSPGIKVMRQFAHEMAGKFTTAIMITQTTLTPAAKKIIPAALPETIIELFLEQELAVNITHHNLVPKHVLLSAEEKKKLLERYRLKETQLPRIQLADPVARYLGLRRGNVVKIIRKSETAGRDMAYNFVTSLLVWDEKRQFFACVRSVYGTGSAEAIGERDSVVSRLLVGAKE